ncbi:MAG: hypothetical protein IJ309_07465 [Clostridia bacterium]|nr:hypothetical protein [Clostridia bacterium]MBQ7907788.1 hypothetical protein [Clostridia bacterium]
MSDCIRELFRELYFGKIENQAIIEKSAEIYEVEKKLFAGKIDRELFGEYDDLVTELCQMYSEEYFVKGFKIGARLTKEALEK